MVHLHQDRMRWRKRGLKPILMKMQYDKDDDILVIEFTNEKIVRDVSLGWNVNVGMTANGVGEIVVLDAKAAGLFPLELSKELKAA